MSAVNGAHSHQNAPALLLPYSFTGTVIRGYGRGGKQLGCPTANLDGAAVASIPASLPCGVYWGQGRVLREGDQDASEVTGFVMSIGYNPQFANKEKTMEVHFLREMDDFYGARVEGTIRGFLREMTSFKGLEELKVAIEKDKNDARALLIASNK